MDFEPANYLNSTHKDSIFVQSLMVVLHTPEGKKVLSGDRFKSISGDMTVKSSISREEIPSLLQEEFSLQCQPEQDSDKFQP